MAIAIKGLRSGRPDYSQFIEKTTLEVVPKDVIGDTEFVETNLVFDPERNTTWHGKAVIGAGEAFQFIPLFKNEELPNKGKMFALKKIVCSVDADSMVEVWLLEYFVRPVTFIPVPRPDAIVFALDTNYQKVVFEPEIFWIKYPNVFGFFVQNFDSLEHEFRFYLSGIQIKID